MAPITGIQQITSKGYCQKQFRLAHNESCILNLRVIGRAMSRNIVRGPNVCNQLSPLECYEPGVDDILKITLVVEQLSSIVSTLALKTRGITRIITIYNRNCNQCNLSHIVGLTSRNYNYAGELRRYFTR
ncbi:NHL repeat protein [Legionella hackeliae]|nr:NHL repeat protein [Legionella hackeliae]STX49018.1 NHL repeat protein [Legionella hackeliae]